MAYVKPFRGICPFDTAPQRFEGAYLYEQISARNHIRGFFLLVRAEMPRTGVVSFSGDGESPVPVASVSDISGEISKMAQRAARSCSVRYSAELGEERASLRVINDSCFIERLRRLMAPEKLSVIRGAGAYERAVSSGQSQALMLICPERDISLESPLIFHVEKGN